MLKVVVRVVVNVNIRYFENSQFFNLFSFPEMHFLLRSFLNMGMVIRLTLSLVVVFAVVVVVVVVVASHFFEKKSIFIF